MKDDTISRQAAIDTAEWAYKACEGNLSYYHDLLVAALMDLTPAQSGWIPCSERLPEKPGQYYVSGGDKVWICEFLIIPNFIGGWCNDVANPVVQAWMPIPEPWKGEEHGTPRSV